MTEPLKMVLLLLRNTSPTGFKWNFPSRRLQFSVTHNCNKQHCDLLHLQNQCQKLILKIFHNPIFNVKVMKRQHTSWTTQTYTVGRVSKSRKNLTVYSHLVIEMGVPLNPCQVKKDECMQTCSSTGDNNCLLLPLEDSKVILLSSVLNSVFYIQPMACRLIPSLRPQAWLQLLRTFKLTALV